MKKSLVALSMAAITGMLLMTGCGNATSGTVSTDGSTFMEEVFGTIGEVFEW